MEHGVTDVRGEWDDGVSTIYKRGGSGDAESQAGAVRRMRAGSVRRAALVSVHTLPNGDLTVGIPAGAVAGPPFNRA